MRSGRPADCASAAAAWLVRRAFFLHTLPASLPFLLLLLITTAPLAAATSTVAPRLARPLYL